MDPFLVSIGVIVVLLVLLLCLALKWRGPQDTAFIAILRVVVVLYSRLLHRLRVVGPTEDPVPPTGAYIVVSNHRSGVDPLIVSILTRRRIRFLTAREYCEAPVLRWFLSALGCIPVNRTGNDLAATKTALKALRDGEVIGIFPQGGIRDPQASLEGKSGVALLATRTKAPVIPVFVHGSPNRKTVSAALVTPSRTVVTFGQPIRFETPDDVKPSREELEAMKEEILSAISRLGAQLEGGQPPSSAPRSR